MTNSNAAQITNNSSENLTVTNGTYRLTLASNESLIASANWAYQNKTIYIDGETLTNVDGITTNSKISLSNKVLTLQTGVTVNKHGTENPSVASENVSRVIA